MFKTFAVKPLACYLWFHLSFGHFLTSFLGSVRVQTLENCDRVVKYYSNYYSTSVPLKDSISILLQIQLHHQRRRPQQTPLLPINQPHLNQQTHPYRQTELEQASLDTVLLVNSLCQRYSQWLAKPSFNKVVSISLPSPCLVPSPCTAFPHSLSNNALAAWNNEAYGLGKI